MSAKRVLCGRAGSGKTRGVVDAVRELVAEHDGAGRFARFEILLPTYSRSEHLKRRLLRDRDRVVADDGFLRGVSGMFDRGIGTFEQLAERRTGIRLSSLAPPAVKDALLRRALADVDVADFRPVARFAGFRATALAFVKEVKSSDPGPDPGSDPGPGPDPDTVVTAVERLAAAGTALPGRRGRKLEGLARVLARYQELLRENDLLDHEDLLRALLDRLRTREPPPLELFALDGFVDLTEVQLRIVQNLAAASKRAVVTLLSDPGGQVDPDSAAPGPFAVSSLLRKQLSSGSGFVAEGLTGSFRASGDLARLERLVAGQAVEPRDADGSVRFLAGADPDDEADRVARTVLGWRAEGIPPNEILVVVRRVDGPTGARVLEALRRHRVPVRRIGGMRTFASPLVRSALRLLRVVSGSHRRGEPLDAVRSGDARGVFDGEADRLGRVAGRDGVRDVLPLTELAESMGLGTCGTWLSKVARASQDRVERPVESVRARLLGLVRTLMRFSFETPGTVVAGGGAAADAAALGRLRDVSADTAQALRVTGRHEVTPAVFVAELARALDQDAHSVRDPRVGVVNVVDAEEARQWEARAVIVAGLRTGEFPAGAREDLFVCDRDRAEVGRRTGVRLPLRLDSAVERERLLFYAAVTRAREKLVLIAPCADPSGDPVVRSAFLETALEILPPACRKLEGENRAPGDVRPAPRETFHDGDLQRVALGALAERFGNSAKGDGGPAEGRRLAETGLVLTRQLLRDGRGRPLVRAARWHSPVEPVLAEGLAARLKMALPRPRSASSLADFVQCSYRHFARVGLGLREAEAQADDGLNPLSAGNLVHGALERALREGRTTAQEAGAVFDEIWAEQADRFDPGLGLVRTRAAMRRAVETVVVDAATGSLAPGFRPAFFEIGFGAGRPVSIPAGEGGDEVAILGRIDRVDTDASGRALVVDYKWSGKARLFGFAAAVDEGRDLQLPLYALALEALSEAPAASAAVGESPAGPLERLDGLRVSAAGVMILRDDVGAVRWLRLDGEAPGGGRYDVSWVDEEREAGLEATRRRVRSLDRSIRSGGIALNPVDSGRCGVGRCPYADLCRFDGEIR